MIEIRIHGRGGQGNVVAAYILAGAAFNAGRYCQAFPAFGAERRGAPVVAFVRIHDSPIRRRSQVRSPDYLIVQDEHLLHDPTLTAGLKPGGGCLVNSNLSSEDLSEMYGVAMTALPAGQMSMAMMGRAVPNVPLLSAFLTLTELMPLDALKKAMGERFKGTVLEKNILLVDEAAQRVPAGAWKEISLARSA
ncbi:MAG: 2-oxoacid:acceptor oxidoreductase family protein [Rhodospirillaceae bacterium]|nr:2-oxoacid:acceptor oxidoreductase family protein [Rhodospirillaceae bacterium]